jgi:hypothetical protein
VASGQRLRLTTARFPLTGSVQYSTVQYIKFRLTPAQVAGFSREATIVVDHPKYRAELKLTPEQLRELAPDIE